MKTKKDEESLKACQESLLADMEELEKSLEPDFRKYPGVPSVIKAKLRKEAWEKRQRTGELFGEGACPVIGADLIGEVLAGANREGLAKLRLRISGPRNRAQRAGILAVESLKKFGEGDKMPGLSLEELMEKSERDDGNCFKIILFDHGEERVNEEVKNSFLEWLTKRTLRQRECRSSWGFSLLKVTGAGEDQVKGMAAHPSVRAVSFFPVVEVKLQKWEIFRS